MASTDYDFQLTRNQIIERAFRIVGVLSLGETLSGEQIDQGQIELNSLVKSWDADHLFLWNLTPLTLTTSDATNGYTLSTDPKVIGIDSAWYVENDSRHKLEVLSWRDWNNLYDAEDTTNKGEPVSVSYNPEDGKAYFYPVPAGTYEVAYLGISVGRDWDSSSDTGAVPQRAANALTYGLADLLADQYGVTSSERQIISRKAGMYFDQLRRSDRDRGDSSFIKGAY